MFRKLIRWLFGYYLLEIKFNEKRFVDILLSNDIFMWDVCYRDNSLLLKIKHKDYSQANLYANKTGSDVHIVKKRGLFVWICKSKKRFAFILGIILFFSLIIISNLYVWDIEIEGINNFPKELIEDELRDNYVKFGMQKRYINCSLIEEQLRKTYPEISWISCYIKGNTFCLNLSETIEPDKIKYDDEPCNIVACKNCVISDIVVQSGNALCEKGQEVKKGDILITGVLNIYNEYEEIEDTSYLHACGNVYGITQLEYRESFDMDYAKRVKKIKSKNRYYFKILNKIIFKPKDHNKGKVISERKIKLGNIYYLPISIYKIDFSEYEIKQDTYSKEEARKKANKILKLYMDDLRKKGVEILQNNVKIEFENGKCIMEGTIKVKEIVGVPSKLETIDEQGEGL